MSDVAADTPLEPARLGPDSPPPTDDESAVASVFARMDLEGTPEPEHAEETPVAEDAQPEETAETGSEEETSADETDETDEAEVESVEELPGTLSELAEAMGIEPDELAGHIRIPSKDADGNAIEVTLADAIRGNLRQADYTAKTNELAQARKEFEDGRLAAQQEWQSRFQQVDTLLETLQSQVQQAPSQDEMMRLLEDDPQEYMRVRAQMDAREQALRNAAQQRHAMTEMQRQEAATQQAETRREQQRLLAQHMPELQDAQKRTAFETELTTYLGSVGYTEDEVMSYMGGVFDNRIIRMAADAMKYANLEKGKKEITRKVKGLPKVKRPGKSRDNPSREDQAVARRNRLRQTGTDEDAAAFVRGLL